MWPEGQRDSSQVGAYTTDSMSDLPRSEAKACWKRAILSLTRYARASSCCLRNWTDLVLPVLNAFFRPARICKAYLSNEGDLRYRADIRPLSDPQEYWCKEEFSGWVVRQMEWPWREWLARHGPSHVVTVIRLEPGNHFSLAHYI